MPWNPVVTPAEQAIFDAKAAKDLSNVDTSGWKTAADDAAAATAGVPVGGWYLNGNVPQVRRG